MIRAVFFDLDDTLVDNLPCHLEANKKAFNKFGLDLNFALKQSKIKDFMGVKVSEMLAILKTALNISETQLSLKKLVQAREKIFLSLIAFRSRLLPGARHAIINANQYAEIVVIVSSGTKKYINLCLKKFSLVQYFDLIISAEHVQHGKPLPDCYLKAFAALPQKLKIKKSQVLVVEDAIKGIAAARAAGLKTLLVPNKFIKVLPKCDYLFKSLKEFDLRRFH